MKTQLYRVKQMAAQRVGRAEKTDLLTEDLQMVEKTVEKVKVACTTCSKKLNACMLSNGPDIEKRKKKLPQLLLGQGLVESAALLGEKSLLGGIMLKAGEAQSAIAGEVATCETELDAYVLSPLHELTEDRIPNIQATKKKLSVARLDMDSAKTRWYNAQKMSQTASSGNKLEAVAKAELLKAEYEDQSLLFQQLQDQLATEMLTFVAGEKSYAQWTVKILEAQLRYHQAAVDILNECLPNVQQQMDNALFRPTFGCPLDVHLRIKEREIALVLEECILFLLENAMDMQGLFRLPGSATKIKKLKSFLNIGYAEMQEFINDIHAVTGVLKLYLRELPDPLLTFELFDEWINASKMKDEEPRREKIQELVFRLPVANRNNLRYLVCFLHTLAENAEVNKMTPSNIAIVIGPNVLWSPDDGGVNLKTTGNISYLLETLVQDCPLIFPEGCNFVRQQSYDEKYDPVNSRFDTKESETISPEPTSGGNIFSDMTKKFHWKDGSDKKGAVVSPGVQGFYNPVANKLDGPAVHGTANEDVSPLSPRKGNGPPPPPLPKDSSHKRNPSLDIAPSSHKIKSSTDLDIPNSGHQRNLSAGSNVANLELSSESKRTPSTRDVPRRPAPPVPKYPPTAPPKSKPPEPPKTKPPDPPPVGTQESYEIPAVDYSD